ncbi:hypothetical protein GW846_03275 [Candidatus Gracilibacteria bacterium]|nr:hypothetical protein [Candidatus Gracilibacteria bacterium]
MQLTKLEKRAMKKFMRAHNMNPKKHRTLFFETIRNERKKAEQIRESDVTLEGYSEKESKAE